MPHVIDLLFCSHNTVHKLVTRDYIDQLILSKLVDTGPPSFALCSSLISSWKPPHMP